MVQASRSMSVKWSICRKTMKNPELPRAILTGSCQHMDRNGQYWKLSFMRAWQDWWRLKMLLLTQMNKCSAQFCASVHIGQTWNLSRHILKKRMPTVGRYTPSFPVLLRLGLGKTTVCQFRIHVQSKCASVSWKVWFSLHTQTRKFWFKKKNSSVISGRFREPWSHLVSVPAVHSQHSLSRKHESWGTRRAKAKVGSDESGQSGRKVTYELLVISYDIVFFILLVSPWYMYKGSCFRDVCADAGVVGGYLRGSTGVHI